MIDELKNKRILVTGHTGFTGSWASIWLNQIGAQVFGYSLPPETTPNLYTEAFVREIVTGIEGDIRDFDSLKAAFLEFQPELVLHLAAQPLVRRSYRIPRETFDVNAQGSANVLEAARLTPSVKGILCITTDKVYKNDDSGVPFVETDELGGDDPYSASKAAAEVIIASYRKSFSVSETHSPLIAVARGGNIIGGGDWSEDRLIPDAIRAFFSHEPLEIRSPNSTRPWQHVLSLVEGYIYILSGLIGHKKETFAQAFNLGPIDSEPVSVKVLLEQIQGSLPGLKVTYRQADLHEAKLLSLNSNLAIETFGWQQKWTAEQSIQKTVDWYKNFYAKPSGARQLCLDQIDSWNKGI